MTPTAWLAKLTDIVSLGQILTNAGPGSVYAICFFLFGSYSLQLPMLVLPKRDVPTYEVTTPQNPVAGTIHARQRELEKIERKLAIALASKARVEAEVAQVTADLATLESQLQSAEQQPVAGARRLELANRRNERRSALYAVTAAKTFEENRLLTLKRESEAEAKVLSDLRALQVLTAQNMLDHLLNHLILIGLVGYVLGTLLNPINRVLFMDWVDALVKKAESKGWFVRGDRP